MTETNEAMNQVVHRGMYEAIDEAVSLAVYWVANDAVYMVVFIPVYWNLSLPVLNAVLQAVDEDLPHPAFSNFFNEGAP